jgi:hypothetical protein
VIGPREREYVWHTWLLKLWFYSEPSW